MSMIDTDSPAARPKRSLGQNFLIDPNYQRKISEAARLVYEGQTVVEIGPGRGALTQHLSRWAKNLIVIEKDTELAANLRDAFLDQPHVSVYAGDFLEFPVATLPQERMLVVSNLPYNVSTQILIRLFENRERFAHLFLMFQREVARRCVETPGSKEFGILSVWCQSQAHVKKLFDVPPTAFRPRPDIVSTVLQFDLFSGAFTIGDRAFIDFVKLIFSQRRKKISNLLKKKYDLKKLESRPDLLPVLAQRAEELDLALMKVMFQALQIQ